MRIMYWFMLISLTGKSKELQWLWESDLVICYCWSVSQKENCLLWKGKEWEIKESLAVWMSRRKSKTYRVWFPKNIIWTYLWLEDCDFFLVNCSFIHFQLVQVNKLKNWWKREEPIFSISALIFSTAHKNRMQSRITRHHEHANPLLPQHL